MIQEKHRYIGITIGPIADTINLSSSPAALWAASYFFSSLSKGICEVLTEDYKVPEGNIISPFYEKDHSIFKKNNGVGLFHDRIVFCAEGFDDTLLDEVKNKALVKTAALFGLSEHIAYLKEYVMMASVSFHATNPILESGQALNCLELAHPFVFKEAQNPLLDLFTNADAKSEQQGRNEAIKALTREFTGFQLAKRKTENTYVLKSLQDITRTGHGYKKYDYYAIVRADGDGMGQILESLIGDAAIRKFSKACLSYCSNVAELAARFDGVTIYAGGDDLLAVMPVESRQGKTVFEFVDAVQTLFKETFEANEIPATTLSFGVTIAYNRFPLYEALEDSGTLLFQYAKERRNCTAVRLQKHSGQSEGLVVSNDFLKEILSYVQSVLSKDQSILLSSLYKLQTFSTLFAQTQSETQIENLFVNIFDAPAHQGNDFLHKTLPKLLWTIRSQENGSRIRAITDQAMVSDPLLNVQYLLRILRFFVEKGGV